MKTITVSAEEYVAAVVPDFLSMGSPEPDALWVYVVNESTQSFRSIRIPAEQQSNEMRLLFRTLESAHTAMLSLLKIKT